MKDAQQVADNWARNFGNSGPKYQQGVQGVTVSPGQRAAAAADLWQQRVSDPAAKTKFAARVGRVDLATWQQATLGAGMQNLARGAAKGKGKVAGFMQQFLPFVDSVAARVRQMPKGSIQDSINRASAMIQGVAQFNRS